MKLSLNKPKAQYTIDKNTATSYGLTLVAGLPFPDEIGDQVQHIQGHLEAKSPGHFTWYGLDHLHATLIGPLRGRYRDAPPLQQDELPADLQGFTQSLNNFFTGHQPFSLKLAGVHITDGGFVLVRENTLLGQLASRLGRYPELDPPKHSPGMHVAIGYFRTDEPLATDEERARFETTVAQLSDVPVGEMMVQQVWLVHYANRTLNRIVGKVPFTLGQTNALTAVRLLRELGIPLSQPPNGPASPPDQ